MNFSGGAFTPTPLVCAAVDSVGGTRCPRSEKPPAGLSEGSYARNHVGSEVCDYFASCPMFVLCSCDEDLSWKRSTFRRRRKLPRRLSGSNSLSLCQRRSKKSSRSRLLSSAVCLLASSRDNEYDRPMQTSLRKATNLRRVRPTTRLKSSLGLQNRSNRTTYCIPATKGSCFSFAAGSPSKYVPVGTSKHLRAEDR